MNTSKKIKEMEIKGEIKPMVYDREMMMADQHEILAEGEYKNVPFFVVSYGSHPCAYVATRVIPQAVSDNTGKIKWKNGSVEVTYIRPFWPVNGCWNIGWDYAHGGDFFEGLSWKGGKKWTIEEILEDVYNVINQIKEDEKC